ncbi:MAG TPA: response regulator transcription factor, partial [Steroidobacteraceae bacterium]|nr:response regulator transcription factor [Steroidobacteraceae bacterium]
MSETESKAAAPTVLVVDDHPDVRASVIQLIEQRIPGCDILEADSAEEALSLFDVTQPAAIVLDIRLPGIDGIELARQVRRRAPHTRVVIHTADDLPIYREAAA